MKIEVLYFVGCPHREATVERIHEVLEALRAKAELVEVEVRDGTDAARLRFPGSPTVRVDGVDIERGAEARAQDALSCRMYGASGIPPRKLLVSAISAAAGKESPPSPGGSRWLAAAGIPAGGLAALPACPACYPLYAGVLSALGLTVDPSANTALTAGLIGIALAALGFRAKARRGYAPLAFGVSAALLIIAAKLILGSDPLVYAGAAALAATGVWNAWRPGRPAPECAACTPREATR